MIQLQLNENDPRTLRITASYLLALAGDITTEITGADRPVKIDAPTFNPSELAEDPKPASTQPDPAAVFGAGKSAPSIVDAGASPTAPEVTPAPTSTPTPPVAPLPPVVTQPSAAAPVALPTANPVPGVEVDARGLPWDARIHSREKTKLVNGNWKNKRGVDENLLQQVEAELAQVMAIPASSSPAPSASVPLPPQTPTPPAAPTDAPSATTASPSSEPFPELMKLIVSATTAGKITQAEVTEAIQKHGFAVLPMLAARPDLIPTVQAEIEAKITANGHTV